jgi:hypothetical protein
MRDRDGIMAAAIVSVMASDASVRSTWRQAAALYCLRERARREPQLVDFH